MDALDSVSSDAPAVCCRPLCGLFRDLELPMLGAWVSSGVSRRDHGVDQIEQIAPERSHARTRHPLHKAIQVYARLCMRAKHAKAGHMLQSRRVAVHNNTHLTCGNISAISSSSAVLWYVQGSKWMPGGSQGAKGWCASGVQGCADCNFAIQTTRPNSPSTAPTRLAMALAGCAKVFIVRSRGSSC